MPWSRSRAVFWSARTGPAHADARTRGRLKRLLADKELEIDALREVARRNW